MRKGSHLTEEHKQKLREKAMGRKLPSFTDEHCARIAVSIRAFNASLSKEEFTRRYEKCGPKKHSEETKALISLKMLGQQPWNAGTRKGRSADGLVRRKFYTMCRNLVQRAVRKGYKKIGHTVDELGYTPQQLREHLERQFCPGMTWENWGNKEDYWNIDHIRPCNTFRVGEQPSIVSALSNLRPLWRSENIHRPWDGSDVEVNSNE